jgi:hypothetical protein
MAKNSVKRIAPEARRKLIEVARAEAKVAGRTSFTISDAPNASRMGIGSRRRAGNTDSLAKEQLFEEWLRYPKEVNGDVVAYVKKKGMQLISSTSKQPVTDGTLRGWVRNWKRGPEGGALYPHIATGREAEITAALSKLSKSSAKTVTGSATELACDLEGPLPERVQTTVNRIVRVTQRSIWVKNQHKNRCQICGETITLADGTCYSEGHHLQPLGAPHDGPDVRENILCVCPNHHAACDFGAILLDISRLRKAADHKVSETFIAYHNTKIYRGSR